MRLLDSSISSKRSKHLGPSVDFVETTSIFKRISQSVFVECDHCLSFIANCGIFLFVDLIRPIYTIGIHLWNPPTVLGSSSPLPDYLRVLLSTI